MRQATPQTDEETTARSAAQGMKRAMETRTLTRDEVRVWQWAIGADPDGIIGPATRARALALGALLPAPRIDVPWTDPEKL